MFKTNIDCGWGLLISLAQIAPRVVLLGEPKPIKLAHDSADSCDAGQKNREMVRVRERGEKQQSSSSLGSLQLIGWTRCSQKCQVIPSCVHNKAALKPQFIPNFDANHLECSILNKNLSVFFSIWRILTAGFLPVVFVWYWYYLDIIWFLCNWVSLLRSPRSSDCCYPGDED